MRRIRSHLTYANVMVTLLAFVVLAGGTAFAANTVFSTDIVDGEVKAPDIASNAIGSGKVGNNQVKSADVRDDSLTDGGLVAADLAAGSVAASELASDAIPADGTDDDGSTKLQKGSVGLNELRGGSVGSSTVQNDSLTGTDVLESSLGVVPDADRVDGRHLCPGEASAGPSFTTICAAGGLIVEAACTPFTAQNASGIARLRTTQASNAFYVINGPANSRDANFGSADSPVKLVSLNGDGAGAVSPTITHFHASSQTGQLTGSIAVRVFAFSPTLASCEFTMDILG